MNKKMMSSMVAGFALLAFSLVQSAPITIDFCNSVFSGANNQNSFSVSNFANSGINFTLQAAPTTSKLTYNTTSNGDNWDGIGINNAEITGGTTEMLTVSFTNGPVSLSRIDLTNLYTESGYAEIGLYNINGSTTWVSFSADASQTPGSIGWKTLNVTISNVTAIAFKGEVNNGRSDYSLKALVVEKGTTPIVPEPGSLMMLGSGLLGLLGLTFIRRKK